MVLHKVFYDFLDRECRGDWYQATVVLFLSRAHTHTSGILGNFPQFCVLFLWILHQITMAKDRTEVSCFVKYLLFFFNVFFWVSLFYKYSIQHGGLLTSTVKRPPFEIEYSNTRWYAFIVWQYLSFLVLFILFWVEETSFIFSLKGVMTSLLPAVLTSFGKLISFMCVLFVVR